MARINEQALKDKLAEASRFLFITGAGISVASGLQTFRGPGGMYKNRSAEQLASRNGFEIHPELTWEWYNERFAKYRNAEPNAGHLAIVELESVPGVSKVEVATQNVDGLHIKAGSTNVYELHGHGRTIKCTGCEHTEPLTEEFDVERLYHTCNLGKLRPNIVWFGENLPHGPFHAAMCAAMDSDIIVVAGTSAQVYPAAGLIDHRTSGSIVIEVNPTPALKNKVDYVIAEGTETGLPKLVAMVKDAKAALHEQQ